MTIPASDELKRLADVLDQIDFDHIRQNEAAAVAAAVSILTTFATVLADEPEQLAARVAKLEDTVMLHRYKYYVLAEPTLPDAVYDGMEMAARMVLPKTSPVHRVGSSNPSDYDYLPKETLHTRAL